MRNILFGILVFPLLINAQTLVVDGNPDCGIFTGTLASKIIGGIFNYCKSCEANGIADNPYATIQKAIDDANNDDTISICDATYDEQVEIKNKNNLTIKKSDSATDDVKIENDGYIFKLDGIDGITIDSLNINSNNNYGIRIVNWCNNLVFKNLDIDTKKDSIETESDIGDFYIEHSVVNSDDDDGFDFSFNVGSVTFNDVNITAYDNAIKFDKNMDGKVELNGLNIKDTVDGIEFNRSNAGFSISDSTIKTQHFAIKTISDVTGDINISNVDINVTNSNAELSGYGIRFESDIKDKLSIVDSNISTKTKSIDLQVTADKYIEIDNVKLTSDNSSPFIVHRISNGIKVSNSTIVANSDGNYAVYFYDEVHNGLEISDVNVSSVGRGIYFRNKIYNDLKMDTVDVNSTQSYGIYFNSGVENNCSLNKILINAQERGIYVNSVDIDLTINNSNITSQTDEGIYTKNANGSKFTLKDSCVRTEADGDDIYALWINNSSRNAEVSNSCFYKEKVQYLAKSSEINDGISGNYWYQNVGDYVHNNIEDRTTLQVCTLPCDDSVVLMADYHFDECVVSNDEDKVDDNSSNENNATAFRDINSTEDGLINRAYDFSGEDLPDYVSVPSVVLNKMVNYTFSMWIKPTSLNNGDTFISAEKSDENTDEMLFGISNNKVVFKHKGNDGEISFDTTVNDFTLNEWNYIALTKDAKEVCLYLNDNEKDCKVSSSDNFDLALSVLDGTFMIGQDSAGIDKYEENGDFQGAIDEVIFFKGALSADDVDDIYNNQENGKNYDGTDRDEKYCDNDDGDSENNEDGNYTFDAWDTFRDINDRNISTKIASKEFSILVASLNETDNDYKEFNGTVCTYIKGTSFKNLFEDDNTSDQTAQGNPTYTITNANKELNVTIKWQKDVDVECLDLVEDNTTSASDSFALRPEKFGFVAPSQQVYAGENFLIDFNATDENDNTVDDYNESLNASFEVNASVVKDGCRIGTFGIADFSFSDGSKDDVDSSYTNIGDLNITIKELDDCSKKYASIDCDDKNVTDHWNTDDNLSIKSYSHTVNIKPYELNITKADINVSTNADWLYMANIDDMNLSMFATVQANNKQHNKLDDFNSSCYGENVDIKFSIDVDDGDNELDMNSTVIANNSTTKDSFKLKDINKTITISKDYFISGEANASYSINVDRNFSNPVNPFLLKDLDINITTSDVAKDENNASDDSNATFYYARVATADKETTDTDIKHFSEIEVYDDSSSKYVAGFKQNSINWYGNKKHNNTFEDISEIDATKKSTLEDVQFTITSFDTDSSKVSFNISNSDEGTYRMHIKTKSWFWYFPAGLGQDYNDSDGSDCTKHPCFEYILKSTSTPSGVVSGKFTGSDYNISSRGNYEKTGVKVFR